MEFPYPPVMGNGFETDASEKEEEEEDSDEEPDEDDEESNGSCTQALIEHVEISFLDLLEGTVQEVEKNQDLDQRVQIQSVKVVNVRESRDEETQTDAPCVLESSPVTEEQEAETRSEICKLRLTRDALINQRKEVSDRIKKGASTDLTVDEKKIYKFEEIVEAIDSAIEFRNEIICGREFDFSDCLSPERSGADLLTHLTNLSTLDLQRLLLKYFSKIVELRHSSKRLERQIEDLENNNDKLNMMLSGSQRHIKDMQAEYESRIKLILGVTGKYDANSGKLEDYIWNLDKKLSNALKKQYDYQRSLTEVLVRHGYLLNGTDYDVKQIVKMLGIDTVQMGLNWTPDEKTHKSKKPSENSFRDSVIPPAIRSALESGFGSQGMSRRMREAYGHHRRGQHQASSSSTRRHYHGGNHLHNDHHMDQYDHMYDFQRFPQSAPPTTAVRRDKQKLIIQQRPDHS